LIRSAGKRPLSDLYRGPFKDCLSRGGVGKREEKYGARNALISRRGWAGGLQNRL